MLCARAITKYALGGLIEDVISSTPDNPDRDQWYAAASLGAARAVRRHFSTNGSVKALAVIISEGIGDGDGVVEMTNKLYALFDFKLKKK